jgi:hypothetical protein
MLVTTKFKAPNNIMLTSWPIIPQPSMAMRHGLSSSNDDGFIVSCRWWLIWFMTLESRTCQTLTALFGLGWHGERRVRDLILWKSSWDPASNFDQERTKITYVEIQFGQWLMLFLKICLSPASSFSMLIVGCFYPVKLTQKQARTTLSQHSGAN